MGNPTSVMTMQGASAAAMTVSSYYSAQANKEALNLQASIADINAQTAESQAQATLAAGTRQVVQTRLRTGQLKSSQRAAMAANGVDLGEGSALTVQTSTDVMGEIDANTVKANAVRAAWGYRTEATNYSNQALMARSSASAISPVSSAVTSLLGGATQVATSWYGLNKAGAFGDVNQANYSPDPIYALGNSRNWWSK